LYRFVLGLLACAAIGACHEEATSPRNHPIPIDQMHNLGTAIVDVDMVHGTVKVHPVGASITAPSGVSGRFFGGDHEIEYHFSGRDQGFPEAGVVEFNLHGGFSNLLDFAIGTNSPHTYPAFPQDTMGVYVYYVFLPYNFTSLGSPCAPPTCTVTIDSVDGTYPFTSGTPQPYVYFKTILEGGGTDAQHQGPFETEQDSIGGINYHRPFSFRTTGNVSTFSFGVSMSAAWVEPNESRWKVFYVADSLPNDALPNRDSTQDLRSEPDWRRLGSTGTATITPANCAPNTGACQLSLVSVANDSIVYYRSDSLRTTQDGYIAATVTASDLTGADPGVFLGLKDPVKLAELGVASGLTGFVDSTGAFVPTYTVATDLARTSYRVAKFGTDSAVIYSPASSTVALLRIPYDSLPPAPIRGSGPPNYDRFFFFGNMTASATSLAATSLWSDVNYEIGVPAP